MLLQVGKAWYVFPRWGRASFAYYFEHSNEGALSKCS